MTGAGAWEDEVLAAARLRTGSEFWPGSWTGRGPGSSPRTRGGAGTSADISTTARPSGDQVVVRLEIHEGKPTRVSALRFEGQPGLSTGRLASAFGLRVGDILDRTRLDPGAEALRTLYRDTGHARARVGAPRVALEGTGAVVTVPVEAGPVSTLRVEGNWRYVRPARPRWRPRRDPDRSVLGARRAGWKLYRYRGFRASGWGGVVWLDGAARWWCSTPEGGSSASAPWRSGTRRCRVELRTVLDRVVRDRRPEAREHGWSRTRASPDAASRGVRQPDPAPSEVFEGRGATRRHHAAGLPRAGLGRRDRVAGGRREDVPSGHARRRFHIVEGPHLRPGGASRACRWGHPPDPPMLAPVSPSASHG